MARCRSARVARRREIEAAPEEVDRAGLANKAGLEALQNAVDLDQRPPQLLRVVRVVRGMPLVLIEWDRRRRPQPDGARCRRRCRELGAPPGTRGRTARPSAARGPSRRNRRSPSVTCRQWSTKSKSTWNSRPPYGIGEVVMPRAVTYSGTCHQWLSGGARASRTLPTIWTHMCRVESVGSQSRQGSSGHRSGVEVAPAKVIGCP